MEYNIAKELAKHRKEKQNITTFTCFRVAVIIRISYLLQKVSLTFRRHTPIMIIMIKLECI